MLAYNFLKTNSQLIYFGSLLLVVVSMPLSRFGLSMGQFAMLAIWLFDGNLKKKARMLWHDKAALILISFYLLHAVGALYSSDLQFAMKDLRVKLPMLFFPIVFATMPPLSKERTRGLLFVFMGAVLTASLVSLWIYLFREVHDFRQLSPFISHIRLSLNACLALFFAAWYMIEFRKSGKLMSAMLGVFILWMVLFLLLVESITGIIILLVTFYGLLIAGLVKFQHAKIRFAALALIILLPLSIGYFMYSTTRDFLKPHKNDLENLEPFSARGNAYEHDTVLQPVENGSFVGLYVCEPELRESWNSRSSLAYDGQDEKGQNLKYTLIRYLNSLGLRKDADAVAQLTPTDIRNVEMGIANVYYTKPLSINSRVYKLLWEYQMDRLNENPGGHSMAQRFEFWRVSMAIIQDDFVFGVGTGDIRQAFADKYEEINSQLESRYRHRAHNQYLAIFVALGVIGFIWFLVALFVPGIIKRKLTTYMYFCVWMTLIISMVVEDTLETQMGATLFAFFNSFFLFGTRDE